MAVNTTRPKNLNLFTIGLPITGVASFLHRVSGIILFLSLPGFLWLLQQSLASESAFDALIVCTGSFLGKLFLFVSLSALIYHFVAGIKHLLMDVGIGESLEGGRKLAQGTLVLSFILILSLGAWLW